MSSNFPIINKFLLANSAGIEIVWVYITSSPLSSYNLIFYLTLGQMKAKLSAKSLEVEIKNGFFEYNT